MLIFDRRQHSRAVTATVTSAAALCLGALLGALLGGCSGGEPNDPSTVTVTAPSTDAGASAPAETTPAAPESDVVDRAHDVGTITDVVVVDDATFLELDRWTYADWSDEKVADEGVPLTPLTDDPFTNQNDESMYTVPVAADVVVGLNNCQAAGTPEPKVATQPGSVDDLTPSDTVWLLTYTDGALTLADTAATC